MDLKVCLAQIETKTGDILGNTSKIIDAIQKSIVEKVDVIVFPETAITSYCCGSLFNLDFFIKDNLKALEQITQIVPKNLHVILGFVDMKGARKDGFFDISNSVAVINNGRVIYTYDKQFMANSNHHEDKKYFLPGNRTTVCKINVRGKDIIIGTPICEDVWSQDHVRNIPHEMKSLGAEILFICNQSYFTIGKNKARHDMYSKHCAELNIPIVQVNSSSIGDIVKNFMIFDGGSSIYVPQNSMFKNKVHISQTDLFKESLFITKLNKKGTHYLETDKNREIFNALVFATKKIFENVGITKGQVHLSGGLDSSIVACLVEEALGKENTIFISNPTICNSEKTRKFAKYIADKLNVKLYWNDFEVVYNSLMGSFKEGIDKDVSDLTKTTFQAVGRTAQGLAAANHFKSAIVCTGNHTEIVLGWASFHDLGSIGITSLIGDLTKVELYMFSKWLNEIHYKDIIIPVELYNGDFLPSAELPDADKDPFDYWVVSGICADLIRDRKSKYQIIEEFKNKLLDPEHYPNDFKNISIYDRISFNDFATQVHRCQNMMNKSVFKTAQSAPNIIINNRSRGFSNRETLLGFYNY